MSKPELSVVIPVFNSAAILPQLEAQLTQALSKKFSYELILVDDGSSDSSWVTIKNLFKEKKEITGIRLNKNYGQDNAILAGLRQSKGNFVVIMDDDLQHAPEDIPLLYENCKKGYEVCYAQFHKKEQSGFKNFGSWLNGKTASFLLNKPADLYLSPFKIIRRSCVDQICQYQGVYPYIDGIILSLTKDIGRVTITHHRRSSGKSNYKFKQSFLVYLRLLSNYSIRPLRIMKNIGLIAAITGFILLCYFLYEFVLGKNPIEGWMTLVALIVLFSGLMLISLGVIGSYLGRIYLTLNQIKPYSIEEVVVENESVEGR